ncbi:MAG: Rpn family recombination-promoting nuclease/putative transposase [Saprospiraceae bacterium]|nr:Rpn family recombination-promoting nuclease/putative transposase [Saprospiraceae bacterium]
MPKQKPPRDMFPHQPHDRYARYALGIPKVASDLIRLSVPPAMFERIDMSTLTLGQESFVDEQMVRACSGFSRRVKNGSFFAIFHLFSVT